MGNFDIQTLLYITVAIFLVLPMHEFAHAWVAHKFGDDTAEKMGRLTLNPFKHLDLMGTVMMYIAHFGWAKPVPVDRSKLKHGRWGMFMVAFAGPLSNLIMAFLAMFGMGIVYRLVASNIIVPSEMNSTVVLKSVMDLLEMLFTINLVLAVFNLLPIPPLDGSRLLSVFLPMRFQRYLSRIESTIAIVFLLVVIVIPRITGNPGIISKFLGIVIGPLETGMAMVVFAILGL